VPVEIAALIATIADLLRRDQALQNLQVTIDGTAPAMLLDPDLLKIAFENVLLNGAHAMQGRGAIHVVITRSGDGCEIAFHDSGPGIPAEAMDRIFTPFFTTKARGTGLGLPTARRLIEAHLGRISVTCPPEGGTIVTVYLPDSSTIA
jgi:signal transduction histidine kinase